MSSLVTEAEKAALTSDLNSVFDTFKRSIVVWKEPQQIPLAPEVTQAATFGFGGADLNQEYNYIPVSGVFEAVVRYANNAKKVGQAELIPESNTFIPVGEVRIKVTPECHSFIENGRTDKISFDNKDWFFVGKSQAAPFMGTLYYFYELTPKV